MMPRLGMLGRAIEGRLIGYYGGQEAGKPAPSWWKRISRPNLTLLKGSVDIHLDSFVEGHLEMEPSLHPLAESKEIDITAFLYAAIRLAGTASTPSAGFFLGQSEEVFRRGGDHGHLRLARGDGQRPAAPNPVRRQKRSGGLCDQHLDVDDIVPSLVVFQIEWNKMHALLAAGPLGGDLAEGRIRAEDVDEKLRKILRITEEDWQTAPPGWGTRWDEKIRAIAAEPKGCGSR